MKEPALAINEGFCFNKRFHP